MSPIPSSPNGIYIKSIKPTTHYLGVSSDDLRELGTETSRGRKTILARNSKCHAGVACSRFDTGENRVALTISRKVRGKYHADAPGFLGPFVKDQK